MKKPLTMPEEAQPRNITRADLVLIEGFGLEVDGRMKTVFLSLSQTQSGWRLIENWAMLLPDVGFVQTDLWNGDGPAAVASSA
jgi:hypothetical protein